MLEKCTVREREIRAHGSRRRGKTRNNKWDGRKHPLQRTFRGGTYPTSPTTPVTPANPSEMPTMAATICRNQWTHTGKSSYVSWPGDKTRTAER